MTRQDIRMMQERIGTVPDGYWGPKSIAACQAHLRRLMPSNNPWPKSDFASMAKFYGLAGDEGNLVSIVPPYRMIYDGKTIRTLRCHKKVSESLLRVLTNIKAVIPTAPDIADEAEDYGGCFNFRNKRGSSTLSMHAWGAAIDLDADDNTFRDHWPMQADMPIEIMECFAREGWISAGAFWGYDAMHFQATQ